MSLKKNFEKQRIGCNTVEMRNKDYMLCTNMSLQILKEQREKLLNDSISIAPYIRIGLHKSDDNEKSIRHLYFEQHCVQWLDEHWNCMFEIIEKQNYCKDLKQKFTLFFAEIFSGLYEQYCGNTPIFTKMVMPEIIKVKKECLQIIIDFDERWEEKSLSLLVDKEKRKEQYRKKIEELTADSSRR